MVLRLSLYLSSLPCGTQTIPLHITVFLVVLRVSLYSSQSPWWNSDYTYAHHRLPRGTQTISILITVSLVVLRLFLYSSKPPWWYLGYSYTHHSLFGGHQSTPNHITFCFVVLRVSLYRVSSQSTYWLRQILYSSQSTWSLRQSLYSSQAPSWYPDYPFTHHSLPGGTRTIPILITVSLVVLRVSLYS